MSGVAHGASSVVELCVLISSVLVGQHHLVLHYMVLLKVAELADLDLLGLGLHLLLEVNQARVFEEEVGRALVRSQLLPCAWPRRVQHLGMSTRVDALPSWSLR